MEPTLEDTLMMAALLQLSPSVPASFAAFSKRGRNSLATCRGPTTLTANVASISCAPTDCSVACEPTPALLMSRFKPWPSR